MRVVLDTNILVSALIAPAGNPAAIYTRSKKLAEDVGQLPRLKRSPDPGDNYLLALAEASKADYLVTGDKSGLLVLAHHKSARIVTARDFADLFEEDAL